MLEREIETPSVAYARTQGWFVRKIASPGNRSAPDRRFKKKLRRGFFCEFKATGKQPTPLQAHEHELMRAAGDIVYVCDSREQFKAILAYEGARMVPEYVEQGQL